MEEVTNQLEPIRNVLEENSSTYPITFNKLIEFLTEVHGVSNVRDMSYYFTSNTAALIKMLNDTHDLSSDRNMKSRINRIVKRIENPSKTTSESDSSQK